MEGFNKTVHVFLYNEYQNFIHDCGSVEQYMVNLKSVINAAWIDSDEMRIAFMYGNTGIVVAKLWSSHYYDTIEEFEDRCISELHDYAEMLHFESEVTQFETRIREVLQATVNHINLIRAEEIINDAKGHGIPISSIKEQAEIMLNNKDSEDN